MQTVYSERYVALRSSTSTKEDYITMKEYKASRRDFIKTSLVGAAVGALGVLPGRVGQAAEAEKAQIKIAGYDYDRVRAFMDGQVGIEGADVSFHYEDMRYTHEQGLVKRRLKFEELFHPSTLVLKEDKV